ncbi:kinase-like protein [Gymnopus androsaceus JB14]|uniref:non-specific serine/threonine protein kinase n=1 Tax=Gymnopus androsaceus JB14 TaxID=1447944 RepID=A0A6A4GNH0_9AGAR|nr:kinase-like protein [Gymnopus androsaceus JB14]
MSDSEPTESELHWPGIPHASEELERYTLGGFHPVHLGDVFRSKNAVYRVLHKLGWGSFATVWLASRTLQEEAKNPKHASYFVALKICAANADSDHEINVHCRLPSDSLHVANLLDSFSLHGPNGSHTVLIYDILARVLSFKLSLDERRSLCHQLVLGVAFLHRNGVIHGGESLPKYLLPPINIATYFTSRERAFPQMSSFSVKIMDLGSAAIIDEPARRCITPPTVVTSESSIASPTFASDIWSLACVAINTDQIFYSAAPNTTHLRDMAKLCGEIPLEFRNIYPDSTVLSPATTDAEWTERLGSRMDKYFEGFGDLMKWMLKMDPAARPSAEQVLQHPWFEQSERHVERKEAIEERYEGGKPDLVSSRNTVAIGASKENIPI